MITIDNMHQGYIFRVCSVVLLFLLYSVTGSADAVHFVCLLYFIHLPEGEGAGGGVITNNNEIKVLTRCTLLLHMPSVCVLSLIHI